METLTPPLLGAIQTLRWMIAAGRSPRDAFRVYLDENADPLAARYRELWISGHAGARVTTAPAPRGVYARALWDVMERGFRGEPVLGALTALEDEVARAARAELDLHLATLPFKMLIPLLAFQFPAHVLLLVGPMLTELTRSLGGPA